MSIFKNKHIILAMFVAPVLAIIAYISVDHMLAEKPEAAQQGATYKLAARSNCRYQSGACTLNNGDVEIHIKARRIDDRSVELGVSSQLPLQHAVISFVTDDLASEPTVMDAASAGTGDWRVMLALDDPASSTLRVAFNISDAVYYAETTAIFVDYETSFSRELFSE
jgi:hypothetical protein